MDDTDEWLTYAEAIEVLGCHSSRIAKLRARGELQTREQITRRRARTKALRREDVERIAANDVRLEAELPARPAAAERSARIRPPEDEHEWVSVTEAARQLGFSREGVLARIQRDMLPATQVGVRWWIRQDLLTIIEAGRLATKTHRI